MLVESIFLTCWSLGCWIFWLLNPASFLVEPWLLNPAVLVAESSCFGCWSLGCWIFWLLNPASFLVEPWLLNPAFLVAEAMVVESVSLVVEAGFFGCWTLVVETGFVQFNTPMFHLSKPSSFKKTDQPFLWTKIPHLNPPPVLSRFHRRFRRTSTWAAECRLQGCKDCKNKLPQMTKAENRGSRYISWVWPLPSNSDHQDYYIFSGEFLYKTLFATGKGPHPRYTCIYTRVKVDGTGTMYWFI